MEREAQPVETGRPLAVLLGASNLTRGLPAAVAATRGQLGGGPIEVLVAAGHGRSYGAWSRVLLRGLPGILDCGLWRELETSAETAGRRRLALLADVGNDIGYGHAPATIAGWVDRCAARLAAAGVPGVIVRLPLASLGRLPAWQLHLAVRLFFPGQRLAPAELLRRAEELEIRLDEVAERRGFARAGLVASWYGLDGIHLWRWKLPRAWRELLASGRATASDERPATATLGDRWRLTVALPQRFELIGRRLEREAAAVRLADGSSARIF